jgi:hypothetical protein
MFSGNIAMQALSLPTRQLSRTEYEAMRTRENAACAALAAKWGMEAIGRDFPLHLSRAGPAIPGEWYIIRDGVRRKATAAQARDLDRVAGHGVHAFGPICAIEDLTKDSMSCRRKADT